MRATMKAKLGQEMEDYRVLVEAMNPQVMATFTGEPAFDPVVADATARLRAAIDALGAS